MTQEQFISYVKEECKKHNIICDLRKTRYVKIDGLACTGAFFPDGKIVVAMKNPDAYEVLVHEYCHMLQSFENIKEWKNHEKINNIEFIEWFKGAPSKNIKKYIKWIIAVELENEKRSVELIKKLNLDFIDIPLYIKKANIYLQFYNWVLIHRKWTKPNKPMHKCKRLLKLVPKTFTMDYTKIGNRLEKEMTKFYYEKTRKNTEIYE